MNVFFKKDAIPAVKQQSRARKLSDAELKKMATKCYQECVSPLTPNDHTNMNLNELINTPAGKLAQKIHTNTQAGCAVFSLETIDLLTLALNDAYCQGVKNQQPKERNERDRKSKTE